MTIISRQLGIALEPYIGLPPTPWNFDASDASTIFTDTSGTTVVSGNSQRVGNWHGAVATNVNSVEAPIYRTDLFHLPVLRFDGQNSTNTQHLELAVPAGTIASNNFSWYGVLKIVGHNLAQGFFVLSEADYPGFQTDAGMFVGSDEVFGSIKTTRGAGTTFIKSDTNWIGDFHLFEYHHRGGSADLIIDGADPIPDSIAVNAPMATTILRIGCSGTYNAGPPANAPTEYAQIDVAQMVFYNSEHTPSEKVEVRTALMNKWMPDSAFYWAP